MQKSCGPIARTVMPRKTPGHGSSGSSADRMSESEFSGGRPQSAYCERFKFGSLWLTPSRSHTAAFDVVFGTAVVKRVNTAL